MKFLQWNFAWSFTSSQSSLGVPFGVSPEISLAIWLEVAYASRD